MSAVLGALLLIYGIFAHSQVDSARDQAKPGAETQASDRLQNPSRRNAGNQPSNGALAGICKNDNPQTRGITKLEVRQEHDVVFVHAWGACTPQDCDWGTEKGVVTADSASVTWDQPFVLRRMTLTPDGSRLRLTLDSVYRDNRPP
jgi:hypothetical protein